MSARTSPAARILGREAELGALRAELAVAMQGSGRLVLLVGDPGIGKTTLAHTRAILVALVCLLAACVGARVVTRALRTPTS